MTTHSDAPAGGGLVPGSVSPLPPTCVDGLAARPSRQPRPGPRAGHLPSQAGSAPRLEPLRPDAVAERPRPCFSRSPREGTARRGGATTAGCLQDSVRGCRTRSELPGP